MKIKIYYDYDAESPREWDPLGTMLCNHRRYNLGDTENPYAGDTGTYEEDFKKYIKEELNLTVNDVIYLPLYLYDHSGLSINTTGFSCSWDSGQLGYVYVTKNRVRGEFNAKRISSKLKKKVEKVLISEVELYDAYLKGEVYIYELIDDDGEFITSCGGFTGDFDDVKKQIKEVTPKEVHEQLDKLDIIDIIG